MKTYNSYAEIPTTAAYIGSENGDGSMDEFTADAIDCAIEPVCFKDDDGTRHYFDLQGD
jgi:hypothetical protein